MTMRYTIAVALGAAVLLAESSPPAIARQSFLKNQPVRVNVAARASAAISKPPQTVDVTLTATPIPGVHVYAPGNPKYIAVAATVTPVAGIEIGAPVFPVAEDYFFAPLKEAVKVYSKPFEVRVPLKVTSAFGRGRGTFPTDTVTIKGTLDYQACDDKVCFPPQRTPFSVDVPVQLARR